MNTTIGDFSDGCDRHLISTCEIIKVMSADNLTRNIKLFQIMGFKDCPFLLPKFLNTFENLPTWTEGREELY